MKKCCHRSKTVLNIPFNVFIWIISNCESTCDILAKNSKQLYVAIGAATFSFDAI